LNADADLLARCEALVARGRRLPGVRVSVDNGWVRLSGWVPRASDRFAIEEAIGRLPGSSGVTAQLRCPRSAG
jgi:hypothetical protein